MRRAVQAFLEASGLPPDDPELAGTPARVAEAWVQHFLDGYGRDPDSVLTESGSSADRASFRGTFAATVTPKLPAR